jgi:hypothetical protein
VRCALTGLIVCFVCCSLAAPAWAQGGQTPRANGPFANLFGANSSVTHALDFHGYLFEAYQEVLLPPEEQEIAELDPLFQRSQTFSGATGALNYRYNRRGDHSFIHVTGYGSVADYSIRPERPLYSALASTSAGLFGQITHRVRAAANVAASYSPYYSYAPFSPTATVDSTFLQPEFGFAATRSSNIPLTATAEVTGQLSRRSTLTGRLAWQKMFVFDDASTSFEGWMGDGRYTRQVYRRLSVYGGYRYGEYRYSGSDNVARTQGADAGFNFGDSLTLQLGRRTTASFFGAVTGAGVTNGRRSGSTTHYALTGSADITRTMGRTWTASAAYNRHLGFVALFDQPVLSDNVTGGVSGLLAPRVNWNLTAGWMQGHVGFDGGANTVRSSYASSTATFAIARMAGLYAQYLYYRYELPMVRSGFNLPTHSARQIASIGLNLSVPIFGHNSRSPRDSR